MTLLLLLTILVLGELPGSYCTVTTVGDLSVLEGQSVTVPCHYNPQYISNVKYWCYGRMIDFCSSLARTDDPKSAPHSKGKVTIADDPTQHVFTVSMQDLTVGDSGWYWCGVELGGMWVSDSTTSLYINVVQGMSVVRNTVSADEGRSVTVQCLYSKNLRSSEKKWCRSGNWNSCIVTDSEGTFSSRNVFIHDDKNSMFTVTLTELEMRDSGWYWCGAGQQHVAVHVSVTPQATTLATASPVQNLKTTVRTSSVMSSNEPLSRPVWESPLMVCGVVLLGMALSLALWKLRKHCKKKQKPQRTNETNDNLTF
ncbi:polymeric immunoglobulin receptor isoform X2 [Pseudorasbora parva]|uniref:polymeric immunoglobulin receptor isoform X2 n=1 Tax=Pseudorasbora parva TaxID=51549 RepID=UPI00351E2A90